MFSRIRSCSLWTIVALSLISLPARAQQACPPVPQVITSARGEVDLRPDRARIELSVETRASTPAAAAAENARRQRAVLDAIQRFQLGEDQIQTAALQVTPEMVYPGQGQPPKVSGYVARNSVRVDVQKLADTGPIIDTALEQGATGVGSLSFYASNVDSARHEALDKAIKAARLDAESMVRAAGYQIAGVLEISSSAPFDGPIAYADLAVSPRGMLAARAAEPTPVNPGELKVVATVTVKWSLRQ